MLNVFTKKPRREYKTAFIKQADNSKIYFKYYKLNRKDMERINALSNIFGQEDTFIIKTKSDIDFNINKFIYINEKRYSINTKYEEDEDTTNGYFVKSFSTAKYITLKG